MNSHLPVLFLSAILIASVGLTPSFAQVVEPVTVSTDKASYTGDETVMISGQVSRIFSGVPVTLKVIAANGNIVGTEQFEIGPDRMFSVEMKPGIPWRSHGEYQITATYGKYQTTATFDFGGFVPPTVQPPIVTPTPTTVPIDGTDTSAGFSITGGSINSVSLNEAENSLIVLIEAIEDGALTMTLAREIIDAKMNACEGDDDVFFVLVDGAESPFEEAKTDVDRTLTIEFFAGSEEIEIIGSCAIPEFGTIAALILAVAIISIIAISARSRLSIMPKY